MNKYRKIISAVLTLAIAAAASCSSGDKPEAADESISEAEQTSVIDLMTNEGIAAAEDVIYEQYVESIRSRQYELGSGKMDINGIKQNIYFQKIGKPSENGYPLYIALRGGGVGDKYIANEQFDVFKNYYNNIITSGVYVVPRCIRASWDEHYRPEAFEFYDRIIEDAIAFYNVDPNRVYLLGFSSGGDGVYAVSPRIADRFAAVNMSAGYPHELRLQNMSNLPICIQMGEKDTAYNRNLMAAEYNSLLVSFGARYGVRYTFDTYIHLNGTHSERWSDWENRLQPVYTGDQVTVWRYTPEKARSKVANTCAVDWLNKYVRDPLPETVLWNTDVNASLRKTQAFYWLDRDGGLDHSIFKVSYSRENNTVNVEKAETRDGTLKIYLCPRMLDVFGDVKIISPDGEFTVRPVISEDIMRGTLNARGDKNFIFTSEIDVTFKDGKAVSAVSADRFDDSYTPPEDTPLYRWSRNGVFYVDNSIFGLSPDELCEKLDVELPAPRKSDNYYDCEWTHLEVQDGRSVIFLFQEGKCSVVYSEDLYNVIPIGFDDEIEKFIGEFTNGTESRHYVDLSEADGKHCIKQQYIWYKYQEWKNMDESISLLAK